MVIPVYHLIFARFPVQFSLSTIPSESHEQRGCEQQDYIKHQDTAKKKSIRG